MQQFPLLMDSAALIAIKRIITNHNVSSRCRENGYADADRHELRSISWFCGVPDHFEVRHKIVETAKNRLRFRFDNRFSGVFPGKLPNRFHRIPESKHYKFHAPIDG